MDAAAGEEHDGEVRMKNHLAQDLHVAFEGPKGANNKARGNAPGNKVPQDKLTLKGRHNAGDGHTIIAPNSGRKTTRVRISWGVAPGFIMRRLSGATGSSSFLVSLLFPSRLYLNLVAAWPRCATTATVWVVFSFCACSALANPAMPIHFLRTPLGGLQPQAVVDASGTVHLVYLHGDPKAADVFYARRIPGRTDFSQPIRINSQSGSAIAIGTVRGAQLALGRNNRVHVVWNGSQPATDPGAKGTPLLYARLDEAGKAFEAQRNLMTSTMNLDGGGSVAADHAGNVYAVWHAHLRTGPDDEIHRGVYVAYSKDDGKTFTPETQVDPQKTGVCGCCGLKAAVDDRGDLAIVYRSADEAGNRDSMLLVSGDRGLTFQSLLLGNWRSSTCPMSTPALSEGPEHSLLAMWETQGQVFRRLIFPDHPIQSPAAVSATGNPGSRKHPVLAFNPANGPHLLIAWVEGTGWEKGGSLAWECIDLKSGSSATGSRPGIPVWGLTAAIPEPDGSFTLMY